MSRKLTTSEFIKKATEKHGDKYDYSKVEYIGNAVPVTIVCRDHGEFSQTPNVHLKPCNCPQCAGAGKKTQEIFIQQAIKVHGNKYNYDKVCYKRDDKKVIIICSKHGEFSQVANSHLQGRGCNICARELREVPISQDVFLKKASLKHQEFYDYSKVVYVGCRKKIIIVCPVHGEFTMQPYLHLYGQGCKKCRLKEQAKIFTLLTEEFPTLEVRWEARLDWLKGQRFDIYIPSVNTAIEYNGRQHYEAIEYMGGEEQLKLTQDRDSLKREKCLQNNCELYELKYDYKQEDLDFLILRIRTLLEKKNNIIHC